LGQKGASYFALEFGFSTSHQAVVSNLGESRGQDVQKEAAQELHRFKQKGFAILGPKGDSSLIHGDKTCVRDCHPMGIASQITHDLLGPRHRTLAVHDPFLLVQSVHKPVEGFGILWLSPWTKRELAPVIGPDKGSKELASKQRTPHFHGKKEVRLRWDPMLPVRRQSSAGYDAVYVRMKVQFTVPRVQYHRDSELSPKPLRIATQFEQGLRGAGKQHVVDELGIALSQGPKLSRKCEDHVEVMRGQRLLHPSLGPAGLG
jgi:hypothetical protein